MADDIATLGVRITAEGVKKTTSDLEKFSKNARNAETTTSKLSRSLFSFRSIIGTLGLAFLAREFLTINKEFQILEARLNSISSSAEAASFRLKEITDISKQLPSTINDVTDSYIRLRNFGLDATSDSLIAYSDIAAATGKTVTQFVEAVADAATLEFERLKEFGLLARQNADSITFLFRGVRTEVAKNSTAIQEFLKLTAQTAFGGAAAKQAETLTGALARLTDSWRNLTKAVGGSEAARLAITSLAKTFDGLSGAISPSLDNKLEQTQRGIAEAQTKLAELNKTREEFGSSSFKFDLSGGFLGTKATNIADVEYEIKVQKARIKLQREIVQAIKGRIAGEEEAVRKDNEILQKQKEFAEESQRLDELKKKKNLATQAISPVVESLRTETEKVENEYRIRLDAIKQAEENKIELELGYGDLRLRAAADRETKLTEIQKQAAADRKLLLTEEQQNSAQSVANIFGNLASVAKEGGKKSFNEYKRFAQAQALVSGALATTNALAVAPAPVGIALATTIAGLTAVQIGKIQQQRYAGRALGGQIIAGDTKLVGENGPELVTAGPQGASVTPNFKLNNMSGAPEVVINMVNNFGSNGPDAITSIKRALPAIQKMVRSVVQSEISAGGRTSRLLGA